MHHSAWTMLVVFVFVLVFGIHVCRTSATISHATSTRPANTSDLIRAATTEAAANRFDSENDMQHNDVNDAPVPVGLLTMRVKQQCNRLRKGSTKPLRAKGRKAVNARKAGNESAACGACLSDFDYMNTTIEFIKNLWMYIFIIHCH